MTSRAQHQPEGVWQGHPILSGLLRTAIFTIPIASALGTTWIVRSQIAAPTTSVGWGLWWALLLALGVIVAMVVERLARRLMPLATLLKLSMLFPDRAPSRFRVARNAGNLKHLESLQTRSGDAGDSATKILTLVTALSNHDRHTRGHAERVRVFTDMLSEELDLPDRDRYKLRWAALLHDIGKLTIDPAILNKPSKLNEHEWTLIQEHPNEGVRLTGPLAAWLGPWGQAIAHHHERVDGTGYPAGLADEQISFGGRIVSVADAYDTMTSVRSYQKPKATAAARRELVANAGTQFDAAIVRAFLAISLPRLLWATGPLSLAVHVPFLAQLQHIGQTSIAAAGQTATVTAVAGVTAMGLMSPAVAKSAGHPVSRAHPIVMVASSAKTLGATNVRSFGGDGRRFVAPLPTHRSGDRSHVESPGGRSDRGEDPGTNPVHPDRDNKTDKPRHETKDRTEQKDKTKGEKKDKDKTTRTGRGRGSGGGHGSGDGHASGSGHGGGGHGSDDVIRSNV